MYEHHLSERTQRRLFAVYFAHFNGLWSWFR
jgi:hypothetical protein